VGLYRGIGGARGSASVASFFVSRVDTLVDKLLDEKIAATGGDAAKATRLRATQGKVAVANAKLAYAHFREIFGGARFQALAKQGARVQRPLWASTSTKNKAYSDVLYVESLIGPDTVNTLPVETLDAFRDHGQVRRTIDEGVDEARATLAALKEAGIDIDAVTQQLEEEGVSSFAKSFDELLAGVEKKRGTLAQEQHEATGGTQNVQIASEESFPASDPPAYSPVADTPPEPGNTR
jgi:transaldolase